MRVLMANDRSVVPAVVWLGPEPTLEFYYNYCVLWALISWKRDTRSALLVNWLSWWVERLLGCQTSVVLTSLPVHWTLIAI